MNTAFGPAGEAIRDQAAFWAERMARPMMDAAEAQAFDRWMDASALHRDAFALAMATWDSPELDDALHASETRDQPVAHAAAEASDWGEDVPARRRMPWKRLAFAAVAACLVLALAAPMLLTRAYRTGPGPGEAVTLADGSRVMLSGNAELAVTMLPWQRTGVLERGEAFFDVRRDGRPFSVDAGAAQVDVLGTAFNIDVQSATRTDVVVYRGAVRVSAEAADDVVLRKGDAALAADGTLTRRPERGAARPEWIDGWFVARDVPLAVVIAKLNRRLDQPIAIADDALFQRRISGRFHVAEPEVALEALSALYGIELDRPAK